MILLAKLINWALISVLPLIFYWLLSDSISRIFPGTIFMPLVILFTSLFYLYIWLFAFASYVDYYLDVWIVTNQRIIDIEQKGLFSRVVAEQKIDRIQDVTSEIKGFFSTMLDYGNVYVQTAGEKERFVFKQVPAPYQVAKKIGKIIEQNQRKNQAKK